METSPQLARMQALSDDELRRVVDTLAPFLSEPRKARIEAALAERSRDVRIVLEDIFDEHNGGAVMRSAEAFGLLDVHLISRVHPFYVSRKVSRGTHKWLRVHKHRHPDEAYAALRADGVEVWASALRGDSRPLTALPTDRPIALVFGNEHSGLSEEALAGADGRFTVPMVGFAESLNISVAAAVSVFELLRARRAAGQLRTLGPAEQARLRAAWYALSVKGAGAILRRFGIPLPILSEAPLSVRERGGAGTPDPEHPASLQAAELEGGVAAPGASASGSSEASAARASAAGEASAGEGAG